MQTDERYRALILQMWRDRLAPSEHEPSAAELVEAEQKQIARAVQAVTQLRSHGAQVIFLRLPSSGDFLAYENRKFPRAQTWDALLAATGAPGIHFEDHPELQGYYLPEWSHLTRSEANRFTAALYNLIAREFPSQRFADAKAHPPP